MLVYIFRASFVKLNFFDWTVIYRGLWEKLRREVREEKQKMDMEKKNAVFIFFHPSIGKNILPIVGWWMEK